MPSYTCKFINTAIVDGGWYYAIEADHAVPFLNANSTQFKCPSTEVPVMVQLQGRIGRSASIAGPADLYVVGGQKPSVSHNSIILQVVGNNLLAYSDGGTQFTYNGAQPGGRWWRNCFNVNLAGKPLYLYVTNSPPFWVINLTAIVTTVVIPKVAIGDAITKSQMDILKDYQYYASNGSTNPTAATQGAQATAALANTYGRGTVSQGGSIQASWYNG